MPLRGDIETAETKISYYDLSMKNKSILQSLNYLVEEFSQFVHKALDTVRNTCLRIVSDKWFDRTIIAVIVLNSILMSMPDYNHVTSSNDLSESGSLVNSLIIRSELAFTIAFTVELVLKATALGLFSNNLSIHKKPYFKDGWNWLDFFVVVFAWLANMQVIDSKSVKVFRLFRVLRPLKSIKSLPAVAAIVTGMLNSMGELRDILLTVFFSFFFFSVVGLQIFIGPYLHTRCRLTPFPVNVSWTPKISAAYLNHSSNYPYELDYNTYRCLDAPNFDYPEQYPHWQQRDSPWFTPKSNCYWPYDMNSINPQVCSLTGSAAIVCANGKDSNINPDLWRWCGSNYDALGNPRFNAATAFWDTYNYPLGYGFVKFDNFGYAFLFVIQVFSGDSWSFMMYQLVDAISEPGGIIFCCLLILFGNFFLLQLNVALLQKSFKSKSQDVPEPSDHETVVEPVIEKPKYHTAIEAYVSTERSKHDFGSMKDNRVHPLVDGKYNSFASAMDDSESPKIDSPKNSLSTDSPKHSLSPNKEKSELNSEQNNHNNIDRHYWAAEFSRGLVSMLVNIVKRVDKPEQNPFRRLCNAIYTNRAFEILSLLVVLFNASILAYNHYGIDPHTAHLMDAGQYLITIFAVFESSMGILGQGILAHFSDNLVMFDTVIVVASSVTTFLAPVPCVFTNAPCATESSLGSVIALRSLRVFMIFRVLKLKFAKMVLRRISNVAKSMQNFLVVLFLFVFLFALVGMNFYANLFRFDDQGFVITAVNSPEWIYAPDRPRSSFDNFTLAFLSVFQIITIDNWSTVMFNCGRALGPWGVVHPTVCFLLGTFFVTNLFLAMLVDSFLNAGVHAEVDEEHVEEATSGNSGHEDISSPNIQVDMSTDSEMPSTKSSKLLRNRTFQWLADTYRIISRGEHLVAHEFLVLCANVLSSEAFELGITFMVCISCISLALDNPLNNPDSALVYWLYYVDLVVTIIFVIEFAMKVLVFGAVHKRTEHAAYFLDGWNILDFVVVVVSILSVTLDSQSSGGIGLLRVLRSLRPLKIIQRIPGLRIIVLSLIVAIPSVAQVGVIVLLIYFIFGVFFLSFLNGQLRACTLPFELTSQQYAPQNDLLQWPIAWADYSDVQRSWFAPGNNYTTGVVTCSSWPSQPCCSANNAGLEFKLTSRFICECWGGSWDPLTDFRFDNIAMSMVTLFDAATIDNWGDNMHLVADNHGVDMQPIRDNQMWWYYIYLIFILVGNFVCIQLFVGVIVKSFSDSKGKLSGHLFITDEQLEWVNTAKVLNSIMPKKKFKKPTNSFRAFVFSICEHRGFEVFVASIIIAQCAVLSITSFGQPDSQTSSLEKANIMLSVLFVLEVAVKWMAYGVKVYLSGMWNRVEFVIVLLTIGYLLEIMVGSGSFGAIGTIMRTSRFIRAIFIIKEIPSMRKFVDFILLTLPAIGNITILVFFCIYIFTVVGVDLFAKTAYNNSYYPDSNFRSFGSAFVTLFRMTTSDNWGQYMYDMSKNVAGCVVNPPYNASYCGFKDSPNCIPLNGCGSVLSFPFWIFYIIMMTFVLLSVFISVIISNYSDLQDGTIRPEDMRAFTALWTEFDPDATCLLQLYKLKEFVGKLFVPMGFGGAHFSERQYLRRVGKIKLLIKKNDYVVHFHDVITVLSAAQFEKKVLWNKDIIFDVDNANSHGPAPGKRLSMSTRHVRYSLALDSADYFTVHHLYCAIRIQRQWKIRKMQTLGLGSTSACFGFYKQAMLLEESYGILKSKRVLDISPHSSTHSLRVVPVVGEMKVSEEAFMAPRSPSSPRATAQELWEQQQFVFPDIEQDLMSLATHTSICKEELSMWSEAQLNELPLDEDDMAVVTAVRKKPRKKRKRAKDRELPPLGI